MESTVYLPCARLSHHAEGKNLLRRRELPGVTDVGPRGTRSLSDVKYGHIIRRLVVDTENLFLDLSRLKQKIICLFNFTPDIEFDLEYVDEHNDKVALVDDEDYSEAARQNLNPLWIFVTSKTFRTSNDQIFFPEEVLEIARPLILRACMELVIELLNVSSLLIASLEPKLVINKYAREVSKPKESKDAKFVEEIKLGQGDHVVAKSEGTSVGLSTFPISLNVDHENYNLQTRDVDLNLPSPISSSFDCLYKNEEAQIRDDLDPNTSHEEQASNYVSPTNLLRELSGKGNQPKMIKDNDYLQEEDVDMDRINISDDSSIASDGDNDIQLSVDPDESLLVDNMSIEGDFIDVEALLVMTTNFYERNSVEEVVVAILAEMGFINNNFTKEILKVHDYNIEHSMDDLCGDSEWDLMLDELQVQEIENDSKDEESGNALQFARARRLGHIGRVGGPTRRLGEVVWVYLAIKAATTMVDLKLELQQYRVRALPALALLHFVEYV
ncbi:hypothetical protein L484_027717 [Morus notabilis]|uniref:PB1 domain-containing protein n=1 Tax=Morus notabilis TaxID=981085 RepID=W9RKN4_9ROSA|nr:hypothetical protein L484_027717 [Morus notabilis]